VKPMSYVFHSQNQIQRLMAKFSSISCCWSRQVESMVRQFDPKIPIEEAVTPPTSWYTDPSFYDFELDRVFYKGWQAVG
ncbi:hypothetical protein CCACVL1_01629, partial [Corchorus capsularis]